MAFSRLSAIVTLAFATAQVANAGFTKRITCPSGQVTAYKACCGKYLPSSTPVTILMSAVALFPIVDKIQKDLFDGGECGEEVCKTLLQCSLFSTLNRLTPLFALPSTMPLDFPFMACSIISIPLLLTDPMMCFRRKVSNLAGCSNRNTNCRRLGEELTVPFSPPTRLKMLSVSKTLPSKVTLILIDICRC